MANSKRVITDEVMEKPVEKAVEPVKKVDPWKQMVEIQVPKTSDGSSNYIIASVNGKTYKVMKGVRVKVPAPIAEVIEHSFEAQEEAELYIASVSE